MATDLSSTMRPFLEEVWEQRQPLVHRVAGRVIEVFPSYATTPSAEVWTGMTRILERIVEGDPYAPPGPADREAAHGTGVQGAGAGIDPADLVGAVLLGAREVEAAVTSRAQAAGVPAAVLLEGSLRTREWAEQVAVWAVQGLRDAARNPAPGGRADRLLRALLEGVDAREHAAALGLDVAGSWWAVAASSDRSERTAEVAVAALRLRHAGRPAAWSTEDEVTRAIVDGRPTTVGGLVVGAAGPVGWDALPRALADAERSRRVAHRFVGSGVHTLDDLGLLVVLHEDGDLARRLHHRWVQPLLAESRHDLAATLTAYLAHRGQVDPVSRELVVHPNTVRNRITRVDRVLGDAWRTPRGHAEVWAALTAHSAPYEISV